MQRICGPFFRIYSCLSRDFVNQHVFLLLNLHWDSPKLPWGMQRICGPFVFQTIIMPFKGLFVLWHSLIRSLYFIQIGHFVRCRSFFSLFWDGCRIYSRQSSTFFDLLKKYQVSLIYFFSRMSSRFWFSFTLLFFYLVFRLLWKSLLFELFRLNNKQGWIFRRCRRAKEFMSSPVLSNHHRRKPSV